MRYVLLLLLLALAIAFDLVIFIAASDGDPLGAFDPHHPATLLPVAAERLDALGTQLREFDAGHFLDVLAAPYRERLRHEVALPTPAP